MRLQNGPSLPLDQQLCSLLHYQTFLAIFILRYLFDLCHSALDVHGRLGPKYQTYLDSQFLDLNQLKTFADTKIRFKRRKVKSYAGKQRSFRENEGT